MFLIYILMGYCALLMFGQGIRSYAKSCPAHMKVQDGECVCPGGLIHSGNIDLFKGCTIVNGHLEIKDKSFRGFPEDGINGTVYDKMHPRELEIFSTLKEINHYLDIQGEHPDFLSLSYFRNLEAIHGEKFANQYRPALNIVRTSLISLELRSLKEINRGRVIISDNKELCFGGEIKWPEFMNNLSLTVIARNGDKKNFCEIYGYDCDEQCDAKGCWGTGSDQCVNCAHFKAGKKCLQACNVEPGLYQAEDHKCEPCHEQCSSCHGPGPDKCSTCKNFKDGQLCVEKCPEGKYHAENDIICTFCDSACFESCTGPKDTVGPGGCKYCKLSLISENGTVDRCLYPNNKCPDGYYIEWIGLPVQENSPPKGSSGRANCKKCHPRCKRCTGYGLHTHYCQECTYFKKEEHCADDCTLDYYLDSVAKACIACDPECMGCTGPGPNSCIECDNIKLYNGGRIDPKNSFRCVSICPPEFPHKICPESAVPYCSAKQASDPLVLVTYIISMVGGISVFIILVGILVYWHRVKKIKCSAIKMAMAMDLKTVNDYDLLEPSNALPNIAHLRIITDREIQRGSTLGKGAFGVVYKGEWAVDGENVLKIPVAIKVLRNNATTNNNKEFLSEAYIMASVDHPNVLKLLAVCMTSEMMLITQLMPHGCLLDFVKKNRDCIGSKTLLSWSAQIANGMAYLEKKRLVHRDLAARNVLVQKFSCVKITDFGLAKLLDINEERYKGEGGMMPIKWLALECIQHGTYTHKTDVWAFGVTVWELLTFGKSPYDNVSEWDVQKLLERGERLPQPNIATIDVYLIMIKCWMFNPDSRPGFTELEQEFAKMSRDPGRYLTIPGDCLMRLQGILSKRVSNRDMIESLASENTKISEAYEAYNSQCQHRESLSNNLLFGTTPSSSTSDEYMDSLQQISSDGNYSELQLNPKLSRWKYRIFDHGTQATSSSSISSTKSSDRQIREKNVDSEKYQQAHMQLPFDAKGYYVILSRKIERNNSLF